MEVRRVEDLTRYGAVSREVQAVFNILRYHGADSKDIPVEVRAGLRF